MGGLIIMNREIKFRVWDPEYKSMDWFENGSFTLNHFVMGCYPRDFHRTLEAELRHDLVFLQYTGLNDKNGEEIYEGAILIDDTPYALSFDPDEVSHKQLIIVKYSDEEGAFLGVSPDSNWVVSFLQSKPERLKIIGNIYENPELLGE
jgi:uncharacterized phage protein (TIGR01671 family)